MKKYLCVIMLMVLLPTAIWADVWQDPETKVNYEYTPGESTASVKAGEYDGNISWYFAGSRGIIGDITILSEITINGNEYRVQSIGDYAFHHCSGLTSVIIPNSVISIGSNAFSYCSGLTSVEIPNSVTSIGGNAFSGCSGLTSVTIPNSVTSIGDLAFYQCSGLTAVTIGNSVISIGEFAFNLCSSLTSIIVSSANTCYDSRNNCNAIIETATNTLICGCNNTVIPNSVTSIGVYAFEHVHGLTSVTIPNSVTTLEIGAFLGCIGLTSVTIGNSVTSIGEGAFGECI